MATVTAAPVLSPFALDVQRGLFTEQKWLPARYFYDDLGSALFEAITLLPEYGLTRADERLLELYAGEIATQVGRASLVVELGSGSGRKTTHIIKALSSGASNVRYCPIDVSSGALNVCVREMSPYAQVHPVMNDWFDGMAEVSRKRVGDEPLLLLFLGSSVGNIAREDLNLFFSGLKAGLRPGDFLLLGADLVKDADRMLKAYDDPLGVTAAFNLNVLGRMNRELGAQFELRAFRHEVRWNDDARRVEMHLVSTRDQRVLIAELGVAVEFRAGETVWTESSHKFSTKELIALAVESGFSTERIWTDHEWPFVEMLWRVLE